MSDPDAVIDQVAPDALDMLVQAFGTVIETVPHVLDDPQLARLHAPLRGLLPALTLVHAQLVERALDREIARQRQVRARMQAAPPPDDDDSPDGEAA